MKVLVRTTLHDSKSLQYNLCLAIPHNLGMHRADTFDAISAPLRHLGDTFDVTSAPLRHLDDTSDVTSAPLRHGILGTA